MNPLVSVITPTWRRHDLLRDQCIPSVRAQLYDNVEHIVVSDGPDRELEKLMLAEPDIVFDEVLVHTDVANNWGSRARNLAISLALGEYIAYLDDDNTWRPDHLSILVDVLEHCPTVDFAYSQMLSHPREYIVGSAPPRYGGIDTSLIVHRADLINKGRWPVPGLIEHAPDWEIVEQWLHAGATWHFIKKVTVDYYQHE